MPPLATLQLGLQSVQMSRQAPRRAGTCRELPCVGRVGCYRVAPMLHSRPGSGAGTAPLGPSGNAPARERACDDDDEQGERAFRRGRRPSAGACGRTLLHRGVRHHTQGSKMHAGSAWAERGHSTTRQRHQLGSMCLVAHCKRHPTKGSLHTACRVGLASSPNSADRQRSAAHPSSPSKHLLTLSGGRGGERKKLLSRLVPAPSGNNRRIRNRHAKSNIAPGGERGGGP